MATKLSEIQNEDVAHLCVAALWLVVNRKVLHIEGQSGGQVLRLITLTLIFRLDFVEI